MKDKIEIETYRGQTIFYDVEADKFTCSISVEDKFKETKRQSLVAVRKEIDTFVKLNLEFKPFKVIQVRDYGDRSRWHGTGTVTAVRTDGTFVYKPDNGYSTSYYSAKQLQEKFAMYDHEAVVRHKEIEAEYDAFREVNDKKKDALLEQLKPVDISRYVMPEPTTNQP